MIIFEHATLNVYLDTINNGKTLKKAKINPVHMYGKNLKCGKNLK